MANGVLGWGALVINTHRLDDIKLVNKWNGPDGYRGRAVVIGAGVTGKDLYAKVWAADQDVVAGECPVSITLLLKSSPQR